MVIIRILGDGCVFLLSFRDRTLFALVIMSKRINVSSLSFFVCFQPTLGMGTYTLKIWGDQGSDAPRAAGYLEPNTALKFGLYTPQPYTPISSKSSTFLLERTGGRAVCEWRRPSFVFRR